MPARVIRTDADRAAWVRFLEAQPLPITVSAIKGAKRSLPQSRTAEKWYSQIAAETGEEPAEVKAQCKWRHGKPIMHADRPDWVAKWSPLYEPLPYQMQIRLFEIIPLTSLLTTRQMSLYMDAVQREYRAQGIDLIDPEARKYAAEFQ
jgi:hypothetical protein